MRNAPDTEFKVHSLLLLFSRAFYVYPLLFCSLQYIYESLYRSYPSVCLCRLQRQPESYSLSYSDHANNLSLLIRFQQGVSSIPATRCKVGKVNKEAGWEIRNIAEAVHIESAILSDVHKVITRNLRNKTNLGILQHFLLHYPLTVVLHPRSHTQELRRPWLAVSSSLKNEEGVVRVPRVMKGASVSKRIQSGR